MRVAEEGLNAGFAGQFLILGKFTAVIEGDGVFGHFGQMAENIRNTLPVSSAVLVFKEAVMRNRVFLSQSVSRFPRWVRNCIRSPSQ